MGKILESEALRRAVRWERTAGRRIALANGLFDLLHVGHVRYLQAARREADRLVVAVNSDVSARSLKGPGRPLVPEQERCEILAALDCVDYITVFSERTVESLIRALAPDVHCKGHDYTPETVPEHAAVREMGGRVVIVGDTKEHATQDLIRRVLERFGAGPQGGSA